MHKKQRNRKIVQQNNRNRIINRRYSSTIKTLTKLFNIKLSEYKNEGDSDQKQSLKSDLKALNSKLYSILDKAVKKNVIHRNTAARKKSAVGKSFTHI